MGPGAGQGWKAVLKNGKAVVVHEIPVPPAEAAAAVPRLQRLYEHRHPALSPVLGWGTDANGVWVAVEPNEGTPLGTILSRGPLTPPAAAALGAAVLSGIAALHEAGIAMGGFNASAVRVTSNGDVRLAGHPAAAVRGAPSQSDLRADVRSCGMAVCAAFGVDPAGAPAPPNIPPGLVVTMRSMASGAMGPAADRAMGALREMASAMLAPDRQVAAQSELALRSGGREVPPITPFLPTTAPAPAAPAPPAPAAAAPAPAPAAPAAPAPPAAPAYMPPARREDAAPRMPASYEAPERGLQTYPSLPAIQMPPAAAAPPAPVAPVAPQEPKPESIPTWAEAPPRAPSYETAPPPSTIPPPSSPYSPAPATFAARETYPPAPAPAPASPAAGDRSPFDSVAPAAAASGTVAGAPSAPEKASRAVESTWSPVEAPVWQPGEVAIPGIGSAAGGGGTATATAPPPVAAPAAERTAAPPARKPPAPRRPAISLPTERPAWLVPAAVAVIVILLLGIGSMVLVSKLRGNTSPGSTASTSPSAKASPHASPTPSSQTPGPVPSFGPATDGPVTKIQICSPSDPCVQSYFPTQTDTSCQIGKPCVLEVAVYVTKGTTGTATYKLELYDRCSRQTIDLGSPKPAPLAGNVLVLPGDNQGHYTVTLPAGLKSGALVAVSVLSANPAAAATQTPFLLGGDSCA